MNFIYVYKVSREYAAGGQLDIPKNVAVNFFNVPQLNIDGKNNTDINICHIKDLRSFEIIQIESSENLRWSKKLNEFLSNNGDVLHDGDLLIFEKLGRSYCVRLISDKDKKHNALTDLFEENEDHMLISSSSNKNNQPIDTYKIKSNYRQYITAIKSKPFLLLAGISGTGKSRIVRELARACWDYDSDEYRAQKPRNFEIVQVKPNWHDSSELIGYVSRINGEKFVVGPFLKFLVKAIKDPEHPYFLCLDEMNLAPVEQYFAEYLSVIESRKTNGDGIVVTDPIIEYEETEAYRSLIAQLFTNDEEREKYITGDETARINERETKRLSIPQNFIVVGTVNMDETTFSFSRKVIDRAMTIEMNEVDLEGGLTQKYEQIGKLGNAELVGSAVEGVDVYSANKDVCDKVISYLKVINERLEGTPFKIAYRTRNEFLLYVVNNLPYNKDDDGNELDHEFIIARALDEVTNMKILSRIEGDETKVNMLFNNGVFADDINRALRDICPEYDTNKSISLIKIDEMTKKLNANGYTSFWS